MIQIKAGWPLPRDARLSQTSWKDNAPQSSDRLDDSREASVFRFGADEVDRARLRADSPCLKVSHKAGSMRAGRPAADFDFFDRQSSTRSVARASGT